MLYFSLFFSAGLLFAAFRIARRSKNPVHSTVAWCIAFFTLPALLWMMFLPALLIQAAVLGVGLLLASALGRGRPSIVPLAILGVVAGYSVTVANALREERTHQRLRDKFAFESLEARLPYPVPPSQPGNPEQLQQLEQAITEHDRFGFRSRNAELKRLHTQSVNHFVNSSGFGVARMSNGPTSEHWLKTEPRSAPPQPNLDYFRPQFPEDAPPATRLETQDVAGFHIASIVDFVNPKGFGYFQDRRNVAGFQSHGFSKVPDPIPKWEVANLELVGLLRHEQPVVYVSDTLPKMESLAETKTRPLDPFETTALAALRAGEDLHIGDGPNSTRLAGAIRSVNACAACHESQRGDLLGAFSYRLRPVHAK